MCFESLLTSNICILYDYIIWFLAIAETSNDQGTETAAKGTETTAVASEYRVGTWCAVCYDNTIYPGLIQVNIVV